MGLFNRKKEKEKRSVVFAGNALFDEVCASGYTPVSRIPEVVACCKKIAELLGSATIYLMNNTDGGDKRIINELSRTIDIEPMPNMTRNTWIESIVMTMLLYGKGNAIVQPHTYNGYIQSLEPIAADRVQFQPIGRRDYKVLIDGVPKDPQNLLHFPFNPDPNYLWKGQGVTASLKDVLNNLVQARNTEKAFLASEYKPALIVRVDANVNEFSTREGRESIIDQYLTQAKTGEPWLIPGEMFDVTQVKPLSLNDLAIKDSMTLNKQTIAALFDVPKFVLGIGEYKRDEWNQFIQGRMMTLAKKISAEMTKKLILNPKWYLMFNVWSLMDFDLRTVSDVLLAGSDRGFVNGDEWRDRMHMSPAGLTEYKVLENYLPYDMSGAQKKLIQPQESGE